jgi:hypothetical protein
MHSDTSQNEQTEHRTSKGNAPKGEATMTPPMPASTKVETWIFIRRARGTNDEGGEGAPQRCLHRVEVRPTTPTSPATAEVVARLSPEAHQTQRRCGLSATLAEAVQAVQHAATHNHRGRLRHSTTRREAPHQMHVPRHSRQRENTHTRGRRPGILFSDGKTIAGDADRPPSAASSQGRRPD